MDTTTIDILSLLDDDCDNTLYQDEMNELWDAIEKIAPEKKEWIKGKKAEVKSYDKLELRTLLVEAEDNQKIKADKILSHIYK